MIRDPNTSFLAFWELQAFLCFTAAIWKELSNATGAKKNERNIESEMIDSAPTAIPSPSKTR